MQLDSHAGPDKVRVAACPAGSLAGSLVDIRKGRSLVWVQVAGSRLELRRAVAAVAAAALVGADFQ